MVSLKAKIKKEAEKKIKENEKENALFALIVVQVLVFTATYQHISH